MTLKIGDNVISLAFVTLEVDVGNLDEAPMMITNLKLRLTAHCIIVGNPKKKKLYAHIYTSLVSTVRQSEC
jgi:hypothetical protein